MPIVNFYAPLMWCAATCESCEMVPMYEPPTVKIRELRSMEKPDIIECRRLGYEMAEALKRSCQIL